MTTAYRFHSIEADGPWTSPEFEPAETRHIIQGVIGGYIMGRPRWAEDLSGGFIYGLDAKGKVMTKAPAAAQIWKNHEASQQDLRAQHDKFRSERIVSGVVKSSGGTVMFSAWSKRVSGRGVYGLHYIAPDGTRQGMRTDALSSLEDAIRKAKALLVAQFGSIKWSKAQPAGPSYGN